MDRLNAHRHYAHAVLRLRHRYGLHMTFEEYLNLSKAVHRSPTKRVDDAGNIDAWVEHQGVMVCACLNAGAVTISTFLPAPPPTEPAKGPAVGELEHEVHVLRSEISKRDMEKNAAFGGADARAQLEGRMGRYRRQANDLKLRCGHARRLLESGNTRAATRLLLELESLGDAGKQ